MLTLLIGMDGVWEILTLALHGGVQVYQRQILLLCHLTDVGYNAVVNDAVINAPCVSVCRNRQAEPYFGFGRQCTE